MFVNAYENYLKVRIRIAIYPPATNGRDMSNFCVLGDSVRPYIGSYNKKGLPLGNEAIIPTVIVHTSRCYRLRGVQTAKFGIIRPISLWLILLISISWPITFMINLTQIDFDTVPVMCYVC